MKIKVNHCVKRDYRADVERLNVSDENESELLREARLAADAERVSGARES